MRFWHFRNQAGTDNRPAEMLLYGTIGDWEGWDDVVDKAFVAELAAIKAPEIHVRINSVGGLLFSGIAMYNALKSHPAKVTAIVEGLAASAASVVAVGADRVRMLRGSMMMIHAPASATFGTAADMRSTAEMLDKARDQLVAIYAEKTGRDPEELRDLVEAETWMTPDEALAAGFADEIDVDTPPVVATTRHGMAIVNGIGLPGVTLPERMTAAAPSENPPADPAPLTRQRIEDEAPDAAAEIRAEAATAERDRIRAIEALALAGHEDLVAAAKYDGTSKAPDVALAIVTAEAERRAKFAGQLRADAADLAVDPSPPPSADEIETQRHGRMNAAGVAAINARRANRS